MGSGVRFVCSQRAHDGAVPRAGSYVALLRGERLAWVLSAFCFLTVGGFVGFSIYLPALLRQQFQLTAADARFRTAGFVLLATGMRGSGAVFKLVPQSSLPKPAQSPD
jgi:nitrate/nitrite transporter NarK